MLSTELAEDMVVLEMPRVVGLGDVSLVSKRWTRLARETDLLFKDEIWG